ncbi:MAG: hypothetical protein ACLFQX_07940 [Candidatus Kapaibacterium sp.]
MRLFIFMITIIIICAGCVSISVKVNMGPPVEPKLTVYRQGDSAMYLIELAIAEMPGSDEAEFLKNLAGIKVELIGPNDELLDFYDAKITDLTDFAYSSEQNKYFRTGYIFAPASDKAERVALEFAAAGEKYRFDTKYDETTPAMEHSLFLQPYVRNISDTSLAIGAIALRIAPNEREYLPSSEDFRADIISLKGKRVWSSQHGKNFLTVIGEVEPKQVGGTHEYAAIWDTETNQGVDVATGEYVCRMVVPAQPKQYIREIKFYRKAND